MSTGADPVRRLLGATLRVGWARHWPRSLGVSEGDEPIGEVFRDAERTRLDMGEREWWVETHGVRVLRALVTDPERRPLLAYAGSVDRGRGLTRRGRTLTVDLGGRWSAWRPVPGAVTDDDGRSVLEVSPVWETGSMRWIVRTERDPAAELDVPPALALWGALVLQRWRAPWLRWTTAGLSEGRIEAELEALRGELG